MNKKIAIVATLAIVLFASATHSWMPQKETTICYKTTVEQGETIYGACAKIASDRDDLQEVVCNAIKDSNIKDPSHVQPGTQLIVHVKRIQKI